MKRARPLLGPGMDRDDELRIFCVFARHYPRELPPLFGPRGSIPLEHAAEWDDFVEATDDLPAGFGRFTLSAGAWRFQRRLCSCDRKTLRIHARSTEATI